jgi:hypothetical protein
MKSRGAGPARCPHCGTHRLRRLTIPDRIDRLQRGPFRLALRLAGAALYHCRVCRLQFHDWRKMAAPQG